MNKHLDSTKPATKTVSRRNFVTMVVASAGLPAVGFAEPESTSFQVPPREEDELLQWAKVRHFARKLSAALSELDGPACFAKIYPKGGIADWPIMFGDIDAERCAHLQIEQGLTEAIEAHKIAFAGEARALAAVDHVVLGREPSEGEILHCDKARKAASSALNALLAYSPLNDVSRYVKVKYVLPLTQHVQISDKQMDVLLTSLCGRFG